MRGGKEYWQRNFDGKIFLSIQSEGKGYDDKLICERFGPFTFGLAVIVDDCRLHLMIRRWNVLGIPLPLFLAPGGSAYEYEKKGMFHFDVNITLPLIGTIVHYQGWLKSVSS